MKAFPSLFISHGSPTILIERTPSHLALKGLGDALVAEVGQLPAAIVVASAHWETDIVRISGGEHPHTVHDFYGFPPSLYQARYPAAGHPALAETILQSLTAAGVKAQIDSTAGFDHGTWIPLALMFPEAQIPVVAVSIQPLKSPEHHRQVGEALRDLRDQGVLVIGSGALTHNLREVRWRGADDQAPDWVDGFGDWVVDHVERADFDILVAEWSEAPAALRNHPTTDHLWPLFVALGAGSKGVPGRVLHKGTELGVLRMDIYAFD